MRKLDARVRKTGRMPVTRGAIHVRKAAAITHRLTQSLSVNTAQCALTLPTLRYNHIQRSTDFIVSSNQIAAYGNSSRINFLTYQRKEICPSWVEKPENCNDYP
ncbi:hypothetical protein DICVIV_08843 [Dictyocaulus viviparus]|uniref:Uncharacterized protein n=1 Tax=Dictyocaulus viviparus TaxID=29172 RepID=A0A0D8XMY8_DICVI|nr:hypothetical protein DICVIV_08843 [Dictyocaulus viviparus]